MESLRAILPWLPLIIGTIYSGVMTLISPNDKLYMFFGLVCIFSVWVCTKKWGVDSSASLSLVEANKKLTMENDGLKENLVKVYNMVQAQSRGGASKPPPIPAPPPHNIPAVSASTQNHPPAAGSGSPEDIDGKPYL